MTFKMSITMLFSKWLEWQIKSIKNGNDIKAFNFNLYEASDAETEFDVQIVGCPSYSVDDPDWACETVFSSGEDLYRFDADDWEAALEKFSTMIMDYLENCPNNVLSLCPHISYGFVDGDLITVR